MYHIAAVAVPLYDGKGSRKDSGVGMLLGVHTRVQRGSEGKRKVAEKVIELLGCG